MHFSYSHVFMLHTRNLPQGQCISSTTELVHSGVCSSLVHKKGYYTTMEQVAHFFGGLNCRFRLFRNSVPEQFPIHQSYREIADRVRIAGRKDPRANTFTLVCDWLCTENNGKWLLILDNIDEARLLHEAPPLSQHGLRSGQCGISRQPL
jgi:hypothetical protein